MWAPLLAVSLLAAQQLRGFPQSNGRSSADEKVAPHDNWALPGHPQVFPFHTSWSSSAPLLFCLLFPPLSTSTKVALLKGWCQESLIFMQLIQEFRTDERVAFIILGSASTALSAMLVLPMHLFAVQQLMVLLAEPNYHLGWIKRFHGPHLAMVLWSHVLCVKPLF